MLILAGVAGGGLLFSAAVNFREVTHHLWYLIETQGEIFAAEGYAKCTGNVGVCIATSGPGATNLVTGLADAMMDSVPLVAITGQVGLRRAFL